MVGAHTVATVMPNRFRTSHQTDRKPQARRIALGKSLRDLRPSLRPSLRPACAAAGGAATRSCSIRRLTAACMATRALEHVCRGLTTATDMKAMRSPPAALFEATMLHVCCARLLSSSPQVQAPRRAGVSGLGGRKNVWADGCEEPHSVVRLLNDSTLVRMCFGTRRGGDGRAGDKGRASLATLHAIAAPHETHLCNLSNGLAP